MTSSHAESVVHTREELGREGEDKGPSPGEPRATAGAPSGARGGDDAVDPGTVALGLAGVVGSRAGEPEGPAPLEAAD